MTTAAARPRASLDLAALTAVLAAVTVIAGLGIKATTGALGTPLPPFVFTWRPAVGPLAIVSVGLLAIGAALAPRLVVSVRRPSACAATLYALALLLGLTLNLARAGTSDWWSVFARGPHGSREAGFEYLPGLRVLRHGVGAYVGHFAQLVPSLPLHAAGNPPAPLVVLHLLGVVSPGGLAALCIGVGALTAPLAYDLGRTLGGEQRGRTAGLLTAFTPSLLLFGVTSADYAFAAMGVGVACLIARPGYRIRLAGALLAAAVSLFSWLLLAIPAWGVVLGLRREGRRSALVLAGVSAAAIIAVNLALALSTGYDPIATLRATDAVYRRTAADRPYAYWAIGSAVAWGVMLGLPIARLALRALARSEPAAVALGAVVLTGAVLGFTKGETERIWLPFAPLACVAAAAVLPRERLARTLGTLAAQAVLVEVLFNTIW
jgi:methylthioxylose transferase